MGAYVTGSGVALPARVVTNEELGPRLGLEAEWIYKASGIRARRWAEAGQTAGSLASEALRAALADASLEAAQLDYLLFGTMTPDRFIPGSGHSVQNALGLREIPCLDIRATCCNALYGLQLAKALVSSGAARNVAVCLAEVQSPWLKLTKDAATTSMLFGDGAAALVVSNEPGPGALEVLDVLLASDGSFVDDLGVRRPGTEFGASTFGHEGGAEGKSKEFGKSGVFGKSDDFFPRMNGQAVILQASRRMAAACRAVLERNGLGVEQVRWLVPHQANANLLAQLARSLGFAHADGVVSVIERLGNTSSASMGIALDALRRAASAREGEYLLLPAFGAGFTWGAALCRA